MRITLADGATFKAALRFRSRTQVGVFGHAWPSNMAIYAGADAAGRALMFTPNPFQGGSSVSHWDTIAHAEPADGAVDQRRPDALGVAPQDLTFALLKDLGWNP